MSKAYKGLTRFGKDVERYLDVNQIRCRFAGWLAMAGDVDLVKIDGCIRRFSISTGKEVTDG